MIVGEVWKDNASGKQAREAMNDAFTSLQAAITDGPSGGANLVYATPNGSSGNASLRALVVADLPSPLDLGTF